MRYYFAPLEGITNALYRNTHARHFAPMAKYFTPFYVPNPRDGLGAKDRRTLSLAHNTAQPLVPQLLCRDPEAFCLAAQCLKDLGYTEVNLNLGCPSGTVVSKGRGAGFLAEPDELRRFFDVIFARSPLPVSLKSRIGLTDEAEFAAIMALFNDYPVTELILHPRLRVDHYRGPLHPEAFDHAFATAKMPLCYNGDLFTCADIAAFAAKYPQVETVMLGRGLIANPALAEMAAGAAPLDKVRLQAFHDELMAQYQETLSGDKPLLHKMKELWAYMIWLFPEHKKAQKRIRKAQSFSELRAAALEVFQTLTLDADLGYRGDA